MRNFVNDIKKNTHTHTESQAARKKVTQNSEKGKKNNFKNVALLFLSAACSLPESVQVGGDPRPPEQKSLCEKPCGLHLVAP